MEEFETVSWAKRSVPTLFAATELGGGHAPLCPLYEDLPALRTVAWNQSEAYRVGTGLAPR
jgi:hypothetical protein